MAASTPIKIVKRALWRPGWYQLDQSIRVGQFERFAFFAPASSTLAQRPASKLAGEKSKRKSGGKKSAGRKQSSLPADLNSEYAGGPLDLQFFNRTITDQVHPLVRFARVLEIVHPKLGPLESVDTTGLDYIFKPVDGEGIFVNAEESPGEAYDLDQPIKDWSLIVTLDDVSEPEPEAIV